MVVVLIGEKCDDVIQVTSQTSHLTRSSSLKKYVYGYKTVTLFFSSIKRELNLIFYGLFLKEYLYDK